MTSNKTKSKGVREEERLYEPVLKALRKVLSYNYVEGETMSRPVSRENPYLEITSESISETLKRELNNTAIQVLTIENDRALRPDIMGFVQRTRISDKELVTVEVKAKPIKIKDILQAKFYQEVYSPTFNLLVSSKGIPEKKLRFLLDNDAIRGDIIIAKLVKYPVEYLFEIDQRFENLVPAAFRNCIIAE